MKEFRTKAEFGTKTKNVTLKEYIEKNYKTKQEKEGLKKEYLLAGIAISIAELREKQGLSQSDLAEKLHTKQQYVSRIEQPENENITIGTLNKIAGILHKRLQVKFV